MRVYFPVITRRIKIVIYLAQCRYLLLHIAADIVVSTFWNMPCTAPGDLFIGNIDFPRKCLPFYGTELTIRQSKSNSPYNTFFSEVTYLSLLILPWICDAILFHKFRYFCVFRLMINGKTRPRIPAIMSAYCPSFVIYWKWNVSVHHDFQGM